MEFECRTNVEIGAVCVNMYKYLLLVFSSQERNDRCRRHRLDGTLCFCRSPKFLKSVWNLSENCQLQKTVRKLSEMCQISVWNLSVTKLCQKYVRSNLEMSLKCIRYHKCVRKLAVSDMEICRKTVIDISTDRFQTDFWKYFLNARFLPGKVWPLGHGATTLTMCTLLAAIKYEQRLG